jgi:simple sugar transport system ATP-binding protein
VSEAPLLEARNIVKRFGGIEALRGASFSIARGEVVALMGDNGAGKSTLVKTMCGVHRPDEGELLFEGQPVRFDSPKAAQAVGMEIRTSPWRRTSMPRQICFSAES